MYSFEHCDKNFELLGEGSSRIVYALDKNTALKLPMTYGGRWQNSNEIKLFKNYKNTVLPLCPLDLSKSTKEFIVMQRAVPLESLEGEDNHLRWAFDSYFVDFVEDCAKKYRTRAEKTAYIEHLIESKCDERIIEFIKKISMFKSNFIQKQFNDVVSFNCGLLNNQLVVIDYGYPDDQQLCRNFYDNTDQYDLFISLDI